MTYDSTEDTKAHIARVQALLEAVVNNLIVRAAVHDLSKFVEPEKSAFDRCTPLLKQVTYGTPEYTAATAQLGEALQHHYEENRHHTEHFENGIAGMTLLDIIEMLCDWKAASERGTGNSLADSLAGTCKKKGIESQLAQIFENTRKEMYW